MDALLDRIQQLEMRTRKVEKQLFRWQIIAFLIGVAAIGLASVLPGYAQPLASGSPNVVTGPFVVKGTNGVKLLEVNEFLDRGVNNSQDAMLTLYRNGQPAVIYRTTGKMYKDAYDPAENYLNVVETWLYRYPRDSQGNIKPTAYLASSTALTRGGGSIAVFNEQGKPTTTPPFAARLSASRGAGGSLILFDQEGNEGKTVNSK